MRACVSSPSSARGDPDLELRHMRRIAEDICKVKVACRYESCRDTQDCFVNRPTEFPKFY